MLTTLRNALATGRSFNLLRWFSVLSFISIGILCVVSSVLLSRFLTEHMLRQEAAVTLEFIQSVANIENTKAYAAGRKPDIRDHSMEEFFDHLAGLSGVLRANIYGPDRTLVWSSDRNLIGQRFTDHNPELDKAMQGHIEIETGVTGRQEHPKQEHMFLSDSPVPFVELYLPIRDTRNGSVIGVAELYRIPEGLFKTIAEGKQLIWLSALGGSLFLFGTLFWIIRRADATIRSQQHRLIESETLAAVGEMGSAVAHGIRNPLASIRSSAELCLDDPSPQVRESATDIVGEVDKLEKWIRDLLSYSQPDSGGTDRTRLEPVVRRTIEQLGREFERRGIRALIELPASLPPVAGDEAALEQVFTSVLTNAMEAMPKGGEICVTACQPPPGSPLVVTVRDSGTGIPAHLKPTLFAPFKTSKAKGMGLGLALVRRIVRRFGGEVTIESTAGMGTSVIFRFVAVN